MSFEFEKLSVLVVEDTMPMRELFVSVLKSLEITNITTAVDGSEALEIFQRDNQDIILTDWSMEPTDGLELTKMVRTGAGSPNRMVPIILVTGYSAWARVEQARDIGVTEFLIKPFSASDIARRITHVITNPRSFIETDSFFGPDRRRRNDKNYTGPQRREADQKAYSSDGE